MSINLDVKSYCHDCPEFEAVIDKSEGRDIFDNLYGVTTTICCKHKERCENIYDHIKNKEEK